MIERDSKIPGERWKVRDREKRKDGEKKKRSREKRSERMRQKQERSLQSRSDKEASCGRGGGELRQERPEKETKG